MVKIIIRQPGESDVKAEIPPGVYRIGSKGSEIRLRAAHGVSPIHAQLTVTPDTVTVTDLSGGVGCTIDGTPVIAEMLFLPQSTLKLGQVTILNATAPAHPTPPEITALPKMEIHAPPAPPPVSEPPPPKNNEDPSAKPVPMLSVSGIPPKHRPYVQEIKHQAHQELLKRLNLKRLANSGISDNDLAQKAKEIVHEILSMIQVRLPEGVTQDKIERELINEAIGLGPLEDLIARDDITEIMVNGPNQVYVEKKGILYRTDTAFADDQQVVAAIERIVSPLGRRIDESSPMVDARLKDGSRVNAIIPPLSLVGPSITIRKFSKTPFKVDNLVNFGSLTYEMAEFLNVCVQLRKNIIISGGTGSGKTTLLNILSSYLPNTERIVTIEDAAELQLRQDHVVRLESRPPNIEGKGEINIRDLVRNSLRMRPDRIVIGECRGGEALDMLQAMNTGHDGSLTTIHANTPRDALARLETLVLMAGFDLPLRAIREQIASAISLIVQINREKDGSRKVTSISEITKMEGEIITLQELFTYEIEGWTADNKLIGHHKPTGSIPSFMDDIKRSGLKIDISIFNDGKGF